MCLYADSLTTPTKSTCDEENFQNRRYERHWMAGGNCFAQRCWWRSNRWAIYQTLPLGSKSSIFDQIWSIYLIWRFHFHLIYIEKRAAFHLLCKDTTHPHPHHPPKVDKTHINVFVPKTIFGLPSLSLFLT